MGDDQAAVGGVRVPRTVSARCDRWNDGTAAVGASHLGYIDGLVGRISSVFWARGGERCLRSAAPPCGWLDDGCACRGERWERGVWRLSGDWAIALHSAGDHFISGPDPIGSPARGFRGRGRFTQGWPHPSGRRSGF